MNGPDTTAPPAPAPPEPAAARRTLLEHLEHHARTRPDAVAVCERFESSERSASWRSLLGAAVRVRDRLGASSDPGAVMISSANCIELLAALLGGLFAGRAVMPVPPELPAPERASLAQRAGVTTLLGTRALADEGLYRVSETLPLAIADPDAALDPDAPPAGARADEGSLLLGSSGTTGLPKIVRRQSAALVAVGENCRHSIGIGETDRMLLAIPLYHSYGIDLGMLTAMVAGCEVELHDRFDAARVRDSLAQREISVLPAVPLMLDALARGARHGGGAPALRRVFSAGSPLPRRVADAFLNAYGVRVGQLYGATEFGSVTFNDPDLPGFESEPVGRAMHGIEIRILDGDSPRIDRPLPIGSEGQIAVASPTLLSEYVDVDEAPTKDGFLLSGDLGRLDERGVLSLTGRLKLLIDIGAQKVNPLEIEAVLGRHPAVSEIVVVALPYTDTASRLKAVVVPMPGARIDVGDLRRFARDHLIHYKVPRRFEIRDDVPRSPTGKILRKALQDAAREGPAR